MDGTFVDTALRELFEESHLSLTRADLVDTTCYITPSYGPQPKQVRYFCALLPDTHAGEVALLPNPESETLEHDAFEWVAAQTAQAMVVPRVKAGLRWSLERLWSRHGWARPSDPHLTPPPSES